MTESWDQYRFRMEEHQRQTAKENSRQPNPMVLAFGKGPEGRICRECRQLLARQFAKVYYKCRFRKNTAGAGTDHRVKWDACSKFEEIVDDKPEG